MQMGTQITLDELKKMTDREGLILQGCGGTWLSDYLPNKLGVNCETPTEQQDAAKPDCPLIGADGNGRKMTVETA